MTDWNLYYRTRFQDDPRRAGAWKQLCDWFQRDIPPNSAVLELGAGYCHFINQIRAARKIALDVSDTVRASAAPGVETHVGSCLRLGFAAEDSVDVVFASNLFEHLPVDDVRQSFSEIRRVLKPGGKFLILQPNYRYAYKHYFDDYTHVSIFTDAGLADLLCASGFEIVRVIPRFLPLSFKCALPAHPALVYLYLRSPWKPCAGQMFVVARNPS